MPFLRWKRSALAAASCILAVRAVVVQLGFYLHMQVTFILERKSYSFDVNQLCARSDDDVTDLKAESREGFIYYKISKIGTAIYPKVSRWVLQQGPLYQLVSCFISCQLKKLSLGLNCRCLFLEDQQFCPNHYCLRRASCVSSPLSLLLLR